MLTMLSLKRNIIFCALLFICSCRITLVPTYSAELEKQITETAKATDKLYLEIIDTDADARQYENFKAAYTNIETEINSILLKNQAREKNQDFLKIIDNLKGAFTEAKDYHKQKNTLSNGEAKAYQATLAGFWAPLYVAEIALKDPKAKN